MMTFTIDQIAEMVRGTVAGDGSEVISQFDKIEEGKKGSISFLANPKYESFLYQSEATAIIVDKKLQLKEKPKANLILVDDPYLAFTTLLQRYQSFKKQQLAGVSPQSFVGLEVGLGEGVYLGAYAHIGDFSQIGARTQIHPQVSIGSNVKIGANCILHPGVRVYDDCVIGDDCILHANAVVGSDGFGFAPNPDGTYTDIPQLGNVVLGNKVSIGANSTIDRATMGSTIIEDGVKIDNLVQIAHNVHIGKHTVIAAQAGISGSAKIGEYCMIGGQVGIAGHITVADRTIVTGQSGITKTVKEGGQILGGTPAMPHTEYLKLQALVRKLPLLFDRNQKD